jgi:hypothetical protein
MAGEKYRLLAARDTSYADGRHGAEQIDLVAGQGWQRSHWNQIRPGVYQPDQGKVTFTGNVRVTGTDGLEAASEALTYDEQNEMASTDVGQLQTKRDLRPVGRCAAQPQDRRRALSIKESEGHFYARGGQGKGSLRAPLVIQSGKADFSRTDGLLKFVDSVTAILRPETGKSGSGYRIRTEDA